VCCFCVSVCVGVCCVYLSVVCVCVSDCGYVMGVCLCVWVL